MAASLRVLGGLHAHPKFLPGYFTPLPPILDHLFLLHMPLSFWELMVMGYITEGGVWEMQRNIDLIFDVLNMTYSQQDGVFCRHLVRHMELKRKV